MLVERLEQLADGYDARQLPRERLREMMRPHEGGAFEEEHCQKEALVVKYGAQMEDVARIRSETHEACLIAKRRKLQGEQQGRGALR